MSLPSKAHHLYATAAVEAFLADATWQEQIEEYGWRVSRPEELLLLVSLPVKPLRGGEEIFTLRLLCDYYPTFPPDVQFVNPATGVYVPGEDAAHVADLRASYCWVHLNYSGYPPEYAYGPQLVCSSMCLGYYFSGHSPTPEQRWQPERHSLGTSLATVYRALRSSDYHGRHHP